MSDLFNLGLCLKIHLYLDFKSSKEKKAFFDEGLVHAYNKNRPMKTSLCARECLISFFSN